MATTKSSRDMYALCKRMNAVRRGELEAERTTRGTPNATQVKLRDLLWDDIQDLRGNPRTPWPFRDGPRPNQDKARAQRDAHRAEVIAWKAAKAAKV